MAEIESPPVVAEESLVPVRGAGSSLLERWVDAGPEQALKRVEAMVRTLEQLRIASIRATYPSDWIIHTSVDRDGAVIKQVGYLQDSGAERAGKIWGIEVGNPAIEREDFPDGSYSYHMIAEAWSKVTGERLEYTEGSRWSGDAFFARQKKTDEDRIDPTDVRKSSYANLHGRAVRALSGLNGVPVDMLRQAGLDVNKVVHVTYDKGARGGDSAGAAVGTVEAVVAFGQSKGKRASELGDGDLDWYIKAYTENVANPEKAKFAKANQRVLDGLKAERERRAQAAAHAAEVQENAPPPAAGQPQAAPPAQAAAEAAPTTLPGTEEEATPRGRLIGNVWAKLVDAAGKAAIPLLAQLTEELFGKRETSLSGLSDDQLRRIAEIPEGTLKATAKALAGKKA